MRIGIVTCCHCHNFGADLQAYALQHVLARMGYDATVIDFNRKAPSREQVRYRRNRAIVNRFRNGGVRAVLELLSVLVQFAKRKATRPSTAAIKHLSEGNDRFERFWTNHISHTARFEIEDLDKADEFDAYIAGSDQIWNWLNTSDLRPYFLTFVPLSKRKISYAASMGESVIPEGYLEVYKEGLRNLDYISVREKAAQEVLSRISGRSVKWVLDPTLLLNREDWNDVASDSIKLEKPYIFSYSLNSSPRYVCAVRKCADKLGLQVVNVMTSLSGMTDKSFGNVYGAGPKEFLGLLRNARFVCTNSFHGTAFAINFGIPFLSVLNRASGGNSRIFSIAAALGLSNHVIMDDASPWEGFGEIDFESVRAKLDEFRNASRQFLEEALG